MSVRLDHVVVLVHDLDVASRQYATDGFTVCAGGTHASGLTHNALIPFADGTYLELLGFTWATAFEELKHAKRSGRLASLLEGKTALDERFLPLGGDGVGLADCAIGCEDMEAIIEKAAAAGLMIAGTFPGARRRPDGTVISWKLGMPRPDGLPFLITDVTERSERVAAVAGDFHANGITGIKTVCYQVNTTRAAEFTTLAKALGLGVRSDETSVRIPMHPGQLLLTMSTDVLARPTTLECSTREGGSLWLT